MSRVTAPEIVLEFAVLRIAPFDKMPEPVIEIGSVTPDSPPDSDSAAPDDTVVVEVVTPLSPNAVLFEIATTPVEIVVAPV